MGGEIDKKISMAVKAEIAKLSCDYASLESGSKQEAYNL